MSNMEQCKDRIIKNFITLMKECDVDVIKQPLIDKGIFSEFEITKIFSSDDARHNKRLFFFGIQRKDKRAYHVLLESLKESNQHKIVKLLEPEITGCQPYCLPVEQKSDDIFVTRPVPFHVNTETDRLKIKVVPSIHFLDTPYYNNKVDFYTSRSKKRGRVLIINNYQYVDKKHEYRNGAQVDNANLHELFSQMGGWEIHQHNNKTSEEMIHIISQFAQDNENFEYDICFVIIMGHGEEKLNHTIIFGIDGNYISPKDIQKHFTNEKCKGFRGKPKIFLFQVCRGFALDYTILRTETDSAQHANPSSDFKEVTHTPIRSQEDILIGYATLHGYKAHRDPNRGSWYIELICKNFMTYACKYPVSTLLQMVDQDLRRRMSEIPTMQTAEYRNKGFKNLYLHPGIYEDGVLKEFNS